MSVNNRKSSRARKMPSFLHDYETAINLLSQTEASESGLSTFVSGVSTPVKVFSQSLLGKSFSEEGSITFTNSYNSILSGSNNLNDVTCPPIIVQPPTGTGTPNMLSIPETQLNKNDSIEIIDDQDMTATGKTTACDNGTDSIELKDVTCSSVITLPSTGASILSKRKKISRSKKKRDKRRSRQNQADMFETFLKTPRSLDSMLATQNVTIASNTEANNVDMQTLVTSSMLPSATSTPTQQQLTRA